MRKTCRTAAAPSLVRNWASAVSGEEHGDLLGGLRVCWHGMTDADYHSWRKPITVVITAPSGPFSVEWNALQDFSVHPPGSALYFLNAEPPGLSVNIAVNGTLPSRLSPLWLGWAPAPQSREVVPLGEADKLHSPLFIISLCSKWSTLFFFFLSASLTNFVWAKSQAADLWSTRTNGRRSDFLLSFFFEFWFYYIFANGPAWDRFRFAFSVAQTSKHGAPSPWWVSRLLVQGMTWRAMRHTHAVFFCVCCFGVPMLKTGFLNLHTVIHKRTQRCLNPTDTFTKDAETRVGLI